MPFGRRDAYRVHSQGGRAPLLANELRNLRYCSRRQTPRGGSLILRAAERENREENNSQQCKADSEAHAFAEALRQINAENYTDYEIHERDQH